MNKIKIIQIDEKQVEEFFNLFKATVSSDFKEWTDKSKEQWLNKDYPVDYWKKLISEDGLPIFVALDDEKMVGYVVVETITYGVVYIGWVGVLRGYRKRGIASRLMEEVEKWSKAKKFHKLELETQIKTLIPFFEEHGFVLGGVRKNSWQKLDNYMFGKSMG